MVLKSIELFGFKSFADRSRIEFRDGISALLGPNGCGKSNVVDAIKWVLGEQSTKSLRAEKMEDVIFNGTEARKALNVAEVTLTLSNEESILPVEMSEISIKRRLYRSGESQYFLNDTPVKLRELRELFFDTGIGKSAYSVMEQGRIDQILSNKPEDRRHIFEEAAGITKYKVRGAEAEKKLERTEENMLQVENILREVKRSYDSLKIQAEKTELFRKYQDDIFSLELDVTLLRMKGFLEDQNKKEELLAKKKNDRDEIRKKIDSINNSLEQNLDLVNSMETELIECQKKIYGLDLEKNNKESQIILLNERLKEVTRQVESDRERESQLKEKLASLKTQQKEKEDLLAELEKRLEEINRNISDFTHNIANAESKIRENDRIIEKNEEQIRNLETERTQSQKELRSITDDIVTQLDAKLKETGYSYKERKSIEEAIENGLTGLKISIEGKINVFHDFVKIGSTSKQEIDKITGNSLQVLEQASGQIEKLLADFTKYKQTVPSFLDEFLSPEGIITKKREIDEKLEHIQNEMNRLRENNTECAEENRTLAKKIDEYRKTLEELRMNSVRMKTQRTAALETVGALKKDYIEQERQRQRILMDIDEGLNRIEQIKEQENRFQQEKKEIEAEEKKLKSDLSKLEENISLRNSDLIEKEKRMKKMMQEADTIQGHLEKIQIDLASIQTEIRNLYENFQDRHSRDLSEFEGRIYEIKETSQDLRSSLQKAKEQQKELGSINLMAPEEFAEVNERYEFLTNQLKDLQKAREDLKKITRQIQIESEELFLETYDKVKKSFHSMFRRLFGGGRAELSLTDPELVLASGIEIYAQPPGKKLENITLLSGGERSLTAVALLFATYMVKPSPFCILDEIDAALDEQNVGRFVNLLGEFGNTSQFIIITHNKKTVAGANTLLGVTMAESGISKIVSVRLDKASEN